MTLEEMQAITLRHWKENYPQGLKALGPKMAERQALACAKLTRMEMDALKAVGVDEETAWTEARSLFCLTPPPEIEEE